VIRPTNWPRQVFHVFSATVIVILVEELLTAEWMRIASGAFAGSFWLLELGRRHSESMNRLLMWIFQHIAHPHESRHVNSATWYATALFILSLTGSHLVCAVGVAVLGLADPMAGIVGRRWGRTRLVHGRSLEGTLAFVAAAVVASLSVIAAWHGELWFGRALAVALAAAIPAAVAELLSRRVDDNFSIPLAAAAGAWLAAHLVG
jgi:dolichol kinase